MIAVGSDAQWVACAARSASTRSRTIRRSRRTPAGSRSASESSQNSRRAIAAKPAAHWRARLDAAGVPNGVVQSVLEALRDTNASARDGNAVERWRDRSLRRRRPRRARELSDTRASDRVRAALKQIRMPIAGKRSPLLPQVSRSVVISTWRPFSRSTARAQRPVRSAESALLCCREDDGASPAG